MRVDSRAGRALPLLAVERVRRAPSQEDSDALHFETFPLGADITTVLTC